MIFFGTRPEMTKLAPIIRKVKQFKMKSILIHSGQHYSTNLSLEILEDLDIKNIDENLGVGSGSHGIQTAKMLERYEEVVLKYQPDIVLALGDTNSVVAASLVCAKLNVPFGHIEAGIRSFDMTMPEEINRRIAAVNASLHFTPSKQATLNLYYEGINPENIYFTGNTAIDATIEHKEIAEKKSNILDKLEIPKDKAIITLTMHRAGNVDKKDNLENLYSALKSLNNYTFVFPVHPRTMNKMKEFGLLEKFNKLDNVILTESIGYIDFLKLMQESTIIMTDSGGLQEEAIVLKKPCITLRTNTERPETVQLGVNFLVGTDTDRIIQTVNEIASTEKVLKLLDSIENPYGDGTASKKILEIIKDRLDKGNLKFTQPSILAKGSLEYRLVKLDKESNVRELEEKYKAKITLVYNEDLHPQEIKETIPKDWFIRIQY
ncbi:MAG: non-hydrolyzing UDP-N-acetylglucosamine 2-epimerase [Candidatus Heimdallarchaeota archaeon]